MKPHLKIARSTLPEIEVKSIHITSKSNADDFIDDKKYKSEILLSIGDVSPRGTTTMGWHNLKGYSKYFKVYCLQVAFDGRRSGPGLIKSLEGHVSSPVRRHEGIVREGISADPDGLLTSHITSLATTMVGAYGTPAGDPAISEITNRESRADGGRSYKRLLMYDSSPALGPEGITLLDMRLASIGLEEGTSDAAKKPLRVYEKESEKRFQFDYRFEFETDNRVPENFSINYYFWVDFNIFEALSDAGVSSVAFIENMRNPLFKALMSSVKRIPALENDTLVTTRRAFFYADGTPYSGVPPVEKRTANNAIIFESVEDGDRESQRLSLREVPNNRITYFAADSATAIENIDMGFGLGAPPRPLSEVEEQLRSDLQNLMQNSQAWYTAAPGSIETMGYDARTVSVRGELGRYSSVLDNRYRSNAATRMREFDIQMRKKEKRFTEFSILVQPQYDVDWNLAGDDPVIMGDDFLENNPHVYVGNNVRIDVNLRDFLENQTNLLRVWRYYAEGGMARSRRNEMLKEILQRGFTMNVYREQVEDFPMSSFVEENRQKIKRIPGTKKNLLTLQTENLIEQPASISNSISNLEFRLEAIQYRNSLPIAIAEDGKAEGVFEHTDERGDMTYSVSFRDEDTLLREHTGTYVYSIEMTAHDPLYPRLYAFRDQIRLAVNKMQEYLDTSLDGGIPWQENTDIGYGLGSTFKPHASFDWYTPPLVNSSGFYTAAGQSNAEMSGFNASLELIVALYLSALGAIAGENSWGTTQYMNEKKQTLGLAVKIVEGKSVKILQTFIKQVKGLLSVYNRFLKNSFDKQRVFGQALQASPVPWYRDEREDYSIMDIMPTRGSDSGGMPTPVTLLESRITSNHFFASDPIKITANEVQNYDYSLDETARITSLTQDFLGTYDITEKNLKRRPRVAAANPHHPRRPLNDRAIVRAREEEFI